jgi:23S rRNA pseudouridine2605 synthase
LKVRLAKRIAESGVASRREAEKLIESGRVAVDGNIVTTPVFFVTDLSIISVDGRNIPSKVDKIVIWKFHKPMGVITSKRDPKNRKTVFDFANNVNRGQRLIYIGRLDFNSEGLLLFTNNGDMARKMELPKTGLPRVYRVRFLGKMTDEKIQKLKKGVIIDGVKYCLDDIKIDEDQRSNRANSWVTITLCEGKNREIRRMLEHVGCTANRLIRVSYGPFNLKNLPQGSFIRASQVEMKKLFQILSEKAKKTEETPQVGTEIV